MAYTAPAHMASGARRETDADAGAHRAYQMLHVLFAAIPICSGIDKFTEVLTDWDKYLAPVIPNTLGIAPHSFMMAVGVIEIVAGLITLFRPRVGAYIVGLWMFGIIGNLCLNPVHYWDVAARDFGLAISAFALGSLSAWRQRH